MRRSALYAIVLLSSISFAQTKPAASAPPAPAATSTELPVKRVVLYKNGVGYFEHAARVRGSQELRIQFTTAQLNDVLKSLTVVDLGGGQINGVRYDSIAPLSERLSKLRVQLGENTNRVEFLRALRGARVEVRSATASITGRLLSVENVRRETEKGQIVESTQFAVMTDGGEMRTFDLNPATSVRIAEPELNREVGQYLNAVGSVRARDVRRMTFNTSGSGDRDVFVSYISEVPVWKSTYRIVMPKDTTQKPLLQGWAIVDNTVGEDWKDVQLSLVAGAPQSFTQQISQPLYVRRPAIELSQQFALTPQTHEAAMDAVAPPPPAATPVGPGVGPGYGGGIGGGTFRAEGGVRGVILSGQVTDPTGAGIAGATITATNDQVGSTYSATANSAGNYQLAGLPPGQYTIRVNSPGFQTQQFSNRFFGGGGNRLDARLSVGSMNETVTVTGAADSARSLEPNATNLFIAKRSAGISAEAEGKTIGDLFEYEIKQRITVLKNQSALVPIVQSRIEADKVTLWSPNDDENAIALRALWLKNTSGLTLDSGTFNIIEGDSFGGEGLIDELHPNERRLVSYAADTAVKVDVEEDSDQRPASRIVIAKGIMKITREERESKTYTIRNSDAAPRQVVIEHPARDQWKLASGTKPEESSSSYHRFRVAVQPDKTATLKVEEFHPEEATYVLTNLNSDQVMLLTQDRTLKPEVEAALKRILAKKNEITSVVVQIQSRRSQVSNIYGEQGRIRENMKALKGSAEEKALLQRYVQNLNQHEDRLTALTREIADLETQQRKLSEELDGIVQAIALDEEIAAKGM